MWRGKRTWNRNIDIDMFCTCIHVHQLIERQARVCSIRTILIHFQRKYIPLSIVEMSKLTEWKPSPFMSFAGAVVVCWCCCRCCLYCDWYFISRIFIHRWKKSLRMDERTKQKSIIYDCFLSLSLRISTCFTLRFVIVFDR